MPKIINILVTTQCNTKIHYPQIVFWTRQVMKMIKTKKITNVFVCLKSTFNLENTNIGCACLAHQIKNDPSMSSDFR